MKSLAVTFGQYTAITALGKQVDEVIEKMRIEFERRGQYMAERLNVINGGCDNNVRLSFACSMEQITKGLDRIEKWLS